MFHTWTYVNYNYLSFWLAFYFLVFYADDIGSSKSWLEKYRGKCSDRKLERSTLYFGDLQQGWRILRFVLQARWTIRAGGAWLQFSTHLLYLCWKCGKDGCLLVSSSPVFRSCHLIRGGYCCIYISLFLISSLWIAWHGVSFAQKNDVFH